MERWIHDSLSGLLDFPVPDDLTQYILKIQNMTDLDEYLCTLLDSNNPKHRQFIMELKRRQQGTLASSADLVGYKKVADDETTTSKKNSEKQGEKKKGKMINNEIQTEIGKTDKTKKKKTKFVNLYSQEGKDRETILLKGRYKCDCEARKHSLINNCSNCGRIVCSQEGSGPCFFCGNLVCSPDQRAILSNGSKQADNLYNKLMDQKPNKALEDSLQHRNKLLDFDRNSARRTEVIDDEADYYQASSVWLSNEERAKLVQREAELREKRHGSRINKKIVVDFAGREINEEEDETFNKSSDPILDQLRDSTTLTDDIACPMEFDRPKYVKMNLWDTSGSRQVKSKTESSGVIHRIQDKELLEMSDDGFCLSMHQPYASLLVAGIKRDEGRTWYSAHRGRLWIAATAKVPSLAEISTVENTYRVLRDENIKFPGNYPTGCLLGCVTVVNVLSQEEYRKQFPEGESDSPYVFLCEDAHELPLRFPIKGKHKIYKLEKKIHHAAVKTLARVAR
ncbi:activating signal cointegrator 1 isoform X2 [Orussus abietinus]|uniref:activating signal cointegrator 1 isoform X2 n=1 Tax=Orussus abietinus TaxID=222816 RepID=UPI0006269AB0|nr:activating signal cointegrator 1 isoform X2 [Orussus abietinus]